MKWSAYIKVLQFWDVTMKLSDGLFSYSVSIPMQPPEAF